MSNDETTSGRRTEQVGGAPRRRGLEGRVIGGRYQVTQTVAAGANTLIADALDTELGRTVTIKLVRPELSESEAFRRRFGKRMDAMAALSHPNLAAVYGWGEERIGKRVTVYVVGEYLSGGSLRDLFDRRRTLTPSQALMVGLEACRGLDFAHRKGLIHTELTPSKLVFGDDRRLRIVDFGLARILGEQAWKDPSQLPTHVARYASPEQALGEKPGDRSDVYSLALILVEAVTGQAPFHGDSTVATLSARVGKLMPVSADLGPLAAVLEHAGRPEAQERFSASQFGRALVRAAERMPRPTPIPILTKTLFDDPTVLRRPNDPTGGLVRPADAPEPALVPIVPPDARPGAIEQADIEQADADAAANEQAAANEYVEDNDQAAHGEPAPGVEAAAPAVPVARRGVLAEPVDQVEAPEASDASAAPEASEVSEASEASADTEESPSVAPTDEVTDEPAGSIDLAALVERTPKLPPVIDDGPDALELGSRQERKAAKARAKAAAREAKTAEREAKAAAREAKVRGDDAPAAAPVPAGLGIAPVSEFGAAPPPAVAPAPEPRRRRVLSFLVGLVLVAALAGIGYGAWVLFRTPTHEVPDLTGLPEDEVIREVQDFDWNVDFDSGRSDDVGVGEVFRTSPEAGKDLAEGSPLVVYVSEGPEYRQLPDLAGNTLDEAQQALEALRLVPGTPSEEYSETAAPGTIISYDVAGGVTPEGVLPGTTVDLVVSRGPQPRTVPSLTGLTPEAATRLLEQFGLTLAVGEPVFSNETEAGLIATQTPAPGELLDRGAAVTAAPSKGPDLVVMPDLTGMNLAQALQALSDAGLRGSLVLGSSQGTFYSATVGDQTVAADDQVLRGSVVNLLMF